MNDKDDLINKIEEIRARNNSVWVEILRIAMEEAPDRTKRVIAIINANDKEISKLLERLAK